MFETKTLPAQPDATAPDGSDVRILLTLAGGGTAHFELAPNETSLAVMHRTVEELWYFIAGEGEMWRRLRDSEDVVEVHRGVAISIPVETCFQFRSFGDEPLAAIAITMPPWPGSGEAQIVAGPWKPTVPGGPL
jgi:mannose-6-phosphate isomerase-like protein (cupin superfamily)